MAKEVRHADVVDGTLHEDEYESIDEHISDGGATGDIVVVQADETLIGQPVDTAIASHIADLDAHTRNIFQLYKTGVYLASPYITFAIDANLALTANRLYAIPFPITRLVTPATIFIVVQTLDAVNSNLRLGLYSDNGSLYPGARLSNGGVVDVSTTGLKTVAYTTQLTRGIIWLVFIADGTPSIFAKAYNVLSILGDPSPGFPAGYTPYGSFYKDDAYGNLPDPFPAGAIPSVYCWAVGLNLTSND